MRPRLRFAATQCCFPQSYYLAEPDTCGSICLAVEMDYFRAIGSAAVHTLVQKSGINTPFTLGAKVHAYEGESIWTLYEGIKRVRRALMLLE